METVAQTILQTELQDLKQHSDKLFNLQTDIELSAINLNLIIKGLLKDEGSNEYRIELIGISNFRESGTIKRTQKTLESILDIIEKF